MKVKYIGTATDQMMVGIGIFQPNDILEVSPILGKQLLQRPDFIEVVEKRKKPKPKISKVKVAKKAIPSTFVVKEEKEGGERSWEQDTSQ